MSEMASWEEIKRLAADFKKIQTNTVVQTLSERNCIEIVSWLIDRKMIELVFTVDGKEFITPARLVQDILGELYVNGGRVNLVDVAKALGVDLVHVNNCVNELSKNNVVCVCGQLIDNTFITQLANEINEKLAQQGEVNVSDLTIQYDLPADFIQQQVIEKNLGRIIHAKQDKSDPRLLFTDSYIERNKAKIKGALAGITKPTSILFIVQRAGVSEKMFFKLFDQIDSFGILTSRHHGAQYIPTIYSESQNKWVSSFYKQNGYLEFESLKRLGIVDHKNYLKRFSTGGEDAVFLNNCIISQKTLEQIEGDIDECINSKQYVDLQNILPSVLNDEDINILINKVLSSKKQQQVIFIENYILSKSFIDHITQETDSLIKEKVEKCIQSGKYQAYITKSQGSTQKQDKREDERLNKRDEQKKRGGKGQNKENKGKSKKTTESFADGDAPASAKHVLEIISLEELENEIKELLEIDEFTTEFVELLAKHLLPKYNERASQMANEIYTTALASRTINMKQMHNEMQEKINNLIRDIRMYEKGIKILPNNLQTQLYKYLLKSLCTDVGNEILSYIAIEQKQEIVVDKLSNDQKLSFVNQLPKEFKNPLSTLLESLGEENIDKFTEIVEKSLEVCGMIIKKSDKKKDRTMVLNHRHSLLDQLEKCEDLALILHLAALYIFTAATQTMLHASGRHIPAILPFLKEFMVVSEFEVFNDYQELIFKMVSSEGNDDEVIEQLKEKVPMIKEIVRSYKKPRGE